MSGSCSAHRHYERECPRCQTEKPAWVESLESQVASLSAENVALRASAREVADLHEEDAMQIMNLAVSNAGRLLEALEAAVFACMLFDYEDEEDVTFYVKRWRTFRDALKEEHFGDCTGQPVSCTRCQAEWTVAVAQRFLGATATVEKDELAWDWHCFICGVKMTAIAPHNRHTPVYGKRRRNGRPPTVLFCDACVAKVKEEVADGR